jgi:hypothetical protein
MARDAALIDAAITVQRWQRRGGHTGYTADRILRHVARALRCYPSWAAIQEAIVRLELGEVETYRLAA